MGLLLNPLLHSPSGKSGGSYLHALWASTSTILFFLAVPQIPLGREMEAPQLPPYLHGVIFAVTEGKADCWATV